MQDDQQIPQRPLDFDAVRAEGKELDALIEKGMFFPVEKRSILRFFGKKQRTFIIQQPYLGTLDYLSAEYIQMEYSEDYLKLEFQEESKRLMAKNARRCARIVALAVLNGYWPIKLLTPLLTSYFLWRITPSKLYQLSVLILRISNLMDFTFSIRFLSVKERTTAPALMEKPEQMADQAEDMQLV